MNTLVKFFLLLTVALVFFRAAQADQSPTAVTLLRFEAFIVDEGVVLEWETGTEIDTAAFKLERADDANGPFTFLADIGFIAALGGPASGATYQEIDETAVSGATYWYQLVEVREDQSQHVLETIMVIVVPPTATPTSQAIGGGGSGGQNTPVPPTSTVAPSSTPQATSTTAAQPTAPAGTGNTPPAPTAPPEPQPTIVVEPTNAPAGNNNNNPTPIPTTISQIQPTATAEPGVVSAAEDEGQPIAQITETPVKEEYPAPESATAYPDNGTPNQTTPYPETTPAGESNPIIIGGDAQPTPTPAGESDAATTSQTENSSLAGQIFLWGGFLFALLIFVGGLFFAIFITTRKRQS